MYQCSGEPCAGVVGKQRTYQKNTPILGGIRCDSRNTWIAGIQLEQNIPYYKRRAGEMIRKDQDLATLAQHVDRAYLTHLSGDKWKRF